MSLLETDTHESYWRQMALDADKRALAAEKKVLELEEIIKKQALKFEQERQRFEGELAKLKQMLFGKRSEKMPRVSAELKKNGFLDSTDPSEVKKTRQQRQAEREKVPTVKKHYPVPADKRHCPTCSDSELKALGPGKETVTYEYIPASIEKHVHIQETLTCPSCDYIVTANAPVKPVENGKYGASFISHVVTAKCCDSLPLYRMEKQFKRIGLPLSRSTLCDLFHQAASITKPIWQRMVDLVALEPLVLADETPIPVMQAKKTHKGYVWAFIVSFGILYYYSKSRSSETPNNILGTSNGILLADAYAGYNKVCEPGSRIRAACWAHVRRKFFDAQANAPDEAKFALDIILDLYKIEYEAVAQKILGTESHLALRRERAPPIISSFESWLAEQKDQHLPKGPMGKAISYALDNLKELKVFIDDVRVPLDNNASERALRIIALGRKNYLFAGNGEAAQNLAGLYSLVATCEMHGINPESYLTDILTRVHTHPAKKIDDLLPHRWKELFADNLNS